MDQETDPVPSMEKGDKVEKVENTVNDEAKCADPPLHRILFANCFKVSGSICHVLTDDPNVFDGDFDLDEVDHDFIPYVGDRMKVMVSAEPPVKVLSIEPEDELKAHTGKITHLTKSFAIVDDDIIYFITDETVEFKKNDEVECVVIEGDYECGKGKYDLRAERMKKVEQLSEEVKRWFNDPTLDPIEEANSDSDNENASGEPKMEFEALKGKEPNEEWYDLPLSLYEILRSPNSHKIKKKLKDFVPAELNYRTYKKRFHAHVHLEEVEMQISFEKYHSREIWIEPENKRFSIMCSKITELRPPIAVGKIFIRFFVKKLFNSIHLHKYCDKEKSNCSISAKNIHPIPFRFIFILFIRRPN